MLNKILRSKIQVLILILALSIFLTAAIALAVTKLIVAEEGGMVNISKGAVLLIRPGALEEDTVISANVVRKSEIVCFYFEPSGTEFQIPVELCLSWFFVGDAEELTLYGDDGEEIEPTIYSWGVRYYIEHFSLYYYRRR